MLHERIKRSPDNLTQGSFVIENELALLMPSIPPLIRQKLRDRDTTAMPWPNIQDQLEDVQMFARRRHNDRLIDFHDAINFPPSRALVVLGYLPEVINNPNISQDIKAFLNTEGKMNIQYRDEQSKTRRGQIDPNTIIVIGQATQRHIQTLYFIFDSEKIKKSED